MSVMHKLTCQGPLNLSDFRQLIKDAQTRPELDALYARLSSSGPFVQAKVERFLLETQQISDPAAAATLFTTYAKDDPTAWTLDSLSDFLASQDNVPTREMAMTRPLSEYYISSSHNTYLVGEQWRGESTVEGYIRVLLAGCRCVERELEDLCIRVRADVVVDCHDGETEPEVYHKLTLTSRVTVREICKAIDKYAFVATPYPIILSAEIHCNLAQQAIMARTMREIFGDKLVTCPIDDRTQLPSPEDLR